jgi:predicted P-loop ATPase
MLRENFRATLPVWPVNEDGHCTCFLGAACKRPGKHPEDRAPGDSEIYAVITGERSGVIVVDIDVKGGVDGFAEWEAFYGVEWPETLTVDTPSGGVHLYFKWPGFPVGNRKLGKAIDIRGDARAEDGLAYVIGPGSLGFERTQDPCTVVPSSRYQGSADPIAECPEILKAWLKIGGEKKEGFGPKAIDATHPHWQSRIEKGVQWAKEMPPSRADGEAGNALLRLCLKLVRTLELPLETAHDIVAEHFNPRCTQADGVTPYPWDDADILHKLEDAAEKSDLPCGLAEGVTEKLKEKAKPQAARGLLPAPKPRKQKDPNHSYKYKIGELAPDVAPNKVTRNALIDIFSKSEDWSGCWQYDDFAKQIVCVDPPIRLDAEDEGLSPDDVSDIVSLLEFGEVESNEVEVTRAIHSASRRLRFHPVREYLASLPPGDPALLDDLGRKLFGDERKVTLPKGEVYAANEFLRRFLVAAVRRILEPGCQVDSILILYGPHQGEGKTKFVEHLFSKPFMRKGLPADLANRDASHALRGNWGVELGELASLLRTEKNAAKDFISWTEDQYRQYGNGERVCSPRQCVFVGTTNDDDFLRDATGNRRFWPVSIPKGWSIPLDWVAEHRDAVWAAALSIALTDEPHWFSREEEDSLHAAREQFIETDAWQDKIEAYCRGKDVVKAADVFQHLGGELKDFDRRKLLRVTDTLKRLGCRTGLHRGQKAWLVPTKLAAAKMVETPSSKLNKKGASS